MQGPQLLFGSGSFFIIEEIPMSDQPPFSPVFAEPKPPDAAVPQIYVNGFEVNLSLSDFSITLTAHNRVLAYMLLSFSTAKTLSESLVQALKVLEETTGHEIMTMKDVKQAIDAKREGTGPDG